MAINWHNGAALALAFFALVMAALVSDRVFERLPHLEDELAYQYQAHIFAAGDITAPIPDEARAFWQPFVITYRANDARFGKYHPGWPLLLALGLWMGQAWYINGLFALLTVALTYRLGREIFGASAGLIAAALVAFSPMALLLNATLMAHSAALLAATAFMYGYWRVTRGRRRFAWAALAGLSLGCLLIIRPSTAVAVALPFVLWTAFHLLPDIRTPRRLIRAAAPYIMLALCASAFVPVLPLFSHATTGDASRNLYRMVWDYDRLGFGEGHGVSGHTIGKGVRNARYDLSLMASDLFGWSAGSVTTTDGELHETIREHLLLHQTYYPGPVGLAFALILTGAFIGLRRALPRLLLVAVIVWFGWPLATSADFLRPFHLHEDHSAIWLWLAGGVVLLSLPLLRYAPRRDPDRRIMWTWLLGMVAACLILLYMAYWVGAQRYSARYYFEALSALALLGALPFAWVIGQRPPRYWSLMVHGLVLGLLVWGLYAYSTPRISVLHGFNQVSAEVIERVRARAVDDRPILVIASGDNMVWRSYGALMALTDPYFNSDIIAAWDYMPDGDLRERLIAAHPGRQVIDIVFDHEESWFADCTPPRAEVCRVNVAAP